MSSFVVAGGGIAGLSSALALSDAGHEAIVLEQAAKFSEVGAGIQIGPHGGRALEALGVMDVLAERLFRPRAIRIRKAANGAQLGEVPLGDEFVNRFGGRYHCVHRSDLLAALLEVARGRDNIILRTNSRVSHYCAADGGIKVSTRNGDSYWGEALIGADGIRSRVRARLLGDGKPVLAGHVLYRVLLDADDVPGVVDTSSVNLWLHPGGHVVHYPVRGGEKFNIVAAINENWAGEGWSEPSDGEAMLKVFSGVADELRALLERPKVWLRWAGADRRPVSKWGEGPVTLIGDAAHPTLPYLASGAVMALEDAVVLGQQVKNNPNDLEAALRAYERIRQPRTARIVESSHRLGGIYHATWPKAAFRDMFIRFTSGEKSLERMSWLYDWRP